MATSSKQPSSFADGINSAMQDIAGAMSAPDADLHFGTEMIKVMGTFLQQKMKGPGQSQPPGGTPAGGPPGGQPPAPPGGGGGGPSPAGSIPGGSAGGSPQNAAMPSMAPPSGPAQPGSGPTPGLSPNPDEMRRMMQEVAGQ